MKIKKKLCVDIKNNFLKFYYYFNVFLIKKQFKKQLLSYFQSPLHAFRVTLSSNSLM